VTTELSVTEGPNSMTRFSSSRNLIYIDGCVPGTVRSYSATCVPKVGPCAHSGECRLQASTIWSQVLREGARPSGRAIDSESVVVLVKIEQGVLANQSRCRFEANLGRQIRATLLGSILAPIRRAKSGRKSKLCLAESTDSFG